jgi:hypothetical protein
MYVMYVMYVCYVCYVLCMTHLCGVQLPLEIGNHRRDVHGPHMCLSPVCVCAIFVICVCAICVMCGMRVLGMSLGPACPMHTAHTAHTHTAFACALACVCGALPPLRQLQELHCVCMCVCIICIGVVRCRCSYLVYGV